MPTQDFTHDGSAEFTLGSTEQSEPAAPPRDVPDVHVTIAWEDPDVKGFFRKLIRTYAQVITNPRPVFASLDNKEWFKPLLFLMINWSLIFYVLTAGKMISELFELGGAAAFVEQQGHPLSIFFAVYNIVLFPIQAFMGGLIGSAVLHFFFWIFGSGSKGFYGTLRAVCYSQAAAVFSIIPIVGFIIQYTYQVLAMAYMHSISTARAFFIMLVPMFLVGGFFFLILGYKFFRIFFIGY